jgi:hypothetical protein
MIALTVIVGLTGLGVGYWFGMKGAVVTRRKVGERVGDLIRLIEEVEGLTPDHRINPTIPLLHLFDIRKDLL